MVTLAAVCFGPSYAQGVVSAPLLVFTNGSGSVSPLQYGQLLEVGQTYSMQGIPGDGYVFSSWQPVNVFTFTEVTFDGSGEPLPPTTNTVLSPVWSYTYSSTLDFTMQPVVVIYDYPGVRTITQGFGWQANFEPVPEQSSIALILCGFAAALVFRASHFNKPTMLPPKKFDQAVKESASSS